MHYLIPTLNAFRLEYSSCGISEAKRKNIYVHNGQ
jgi:hypothetical protein